VDTLRIWPRYTAVADGEIYAGWDPYLYDPFNELVAGVVSGGGTGDEDVDILDDSNVAEAQAQLTLELPPVISDVGDLPAATLQQILDAIRAEPNVLVLAVSTVNVRNAGEIVTIALRNSVTGKLDYRWFRKKANGTLTKIVLKDLPASAGGLNELFEAAREMREFEALRVSQITRTSAGDFDVTLSVTATGAGQIHYRWYKQNATTGEYEPIAYQVLPTLRLERTEDSGRYLCRVKDRSGIVLSSAPVDVKIGPVKQ